MVKKISDNEIYLLIKYTKSVLWRVTKRPSYIENARCLKVNSGKKNDCFTLRPTHVLTTSRAILLRMRNVSDKIFGENQNTHFTFQ